MWGALAISLSQMRLDGGDGVLITLDRLKPLLAAGSLF
ncbi:hypothetical protein FHS94_003480 [Sphingomonas aerophila]|uniref:Uncharacterized protein n=1 Tax=Sphingomonas aerophila TaxID=1344948 RepID=A0A7W9BG34_9SPHN|nr:hypothetical protein [Sphingomonas aerophila]